jgi:serine/threonine-protein kinase
MVTPRGQAKVMDFGLAKAPGLTQLTEAGTTLGTVAYMSPEQGRGEAVDARSDIWSLGVVLYEMVSGTLPFKGNHEQAIMHAILNDDPVPLTGIRSNVPMELERIVGKCLEKQPTRRYQDVDDLLVDLRRLGDSLEGSQGRSTSMRAARPKRNSLLAPVVGAVAVVATLAIILMFAYPRLFRRAPDQGAPGLSKIAVLFFENLGPPDDEYFANGITDAITARLAGIHGLGVISRQSTIQYKGSNKSVHEIGSELGAEYILEGTIQRERPGDPASRVRIIPQLISVADDIHLWADTYDEDMSEVFRVQSDIAERVATALNITLLEPERRALDSAPTGNLEAYEYFLRGNEYFNERYGLEAARLMIRMYERSVELDRSFAAAWAGLSTAHIWMYYAFTADTDSKERAKAAVDEALELDPDLPEVQMALGYYYYYGNMEFDRALEHFEKARENRPSSAEVIGAIAYIKRRQGKWQECARLLERAAVLDPRSRNPNMELGITYTMMRRYDEAERFLDRAITLGPDQSLAHLYRIWVCLLRGDIAAARVALSDASKMIKPTGLGISATAFQHVRILPEAYDEILSRVPASEYGVMEEPAEFNLGLAELSLQLGRDKDATHYYQAAIDTLESKFGNDVPNRMKVYIGLAYAGLGRKEDAIRAAEAALEAMPVSFDALEGVLTGLTAAVVFVKAGANERALDQLEMLLAVPSEISPALLRIDPVWDPLRDHPRFQKLVGKKQ